MTAEEYTKRALDIRQKLNEFLFDAGYYSDALYIKGLNDILNKDFTNPKKQTKPFVKMVDDWRR